MRRTRHRNLPNAFAILRRSSPEGRWITGGDWDHERWPDAKLPTKELIDRYTPNTPVFVNRLDGHMALANSLALKLAGVTSATKDPDGGVIVRDAKTGEPTGVLKDAAQSFVWKVIPPSTFEEKLAAARAATNHAASLGVTSVQDVSAGTDVGVYQTSARSRRVEDARIRGLAPAELGDVGADRRARAVWQRNAAHGRLERLSQTEVLDRRRRCSTNRIATRRTRAAFPATKCFRKARCWNACAARIAPDCTC